MTNGTEWNVRSDHPGSDLDRSSTSVISEPDRRLHGLVRGYLGYAERFAGVSRQLEVPTGGVVLIVGLGSTVRVLDPRRGEGAIEHRGGFVAGLHDGPVATETLEESFGVQVSLTPVGARRLLGTPMDGIANRTVDLEDLLGGTGRRLVERVREAPDWAARFRVLDDEIATRVAATAPPSPEIVDAWRRLTASGGRLPIGALATDLGWSQKRLLAGFREEIGLPPKVFAQVVRFRQTLALVEQAAEVRWAEVAAIAGYYDQAHMNRDFRRFTGSSPGVFLNRRRPVRSEVVATETIEELFS